MIQPMDVNTWAFLAFVAAVIAAYLLGKTHRPPRRVEVAPLLRFLAERGGTVDESDPGLAPFADIIGPAERGGLVSQGSGFAAHIRLTDKGRHIAAP